MKISVYIPCYNSEKTIEQCIKALKKQSSKPAEIIVIDDGSTDATKKIALEQKTKVISHKKNLGIATARNTALKHAKHEFVAGIDSDAIADKNWLKNLYQTMKKEDAVLIGGQVNEQVKTLADKWRSIHMNQSWGKKKIINPKYVSGNNFLSVKKTILEIGGYNTKYKTNYEDVDISKRLKKANHKIIYEPKAKIQHNIRDSTTTVLNRHWKHMFWDYPTPNNFQNKFLKVIINFYTVLKFLLKDIVTKPKLLLIDIILFFHHSLNDLKYK
ncbi:MAG: glycosyltransferase [Nanoarchaeota archaeon]